MVRRRVFYSFHYQNDVMRVQQIRNIGAIEGNTPAQPNDWEQIQNNSNAIKKWIDDNMNNRSCVVVLVGEETANRNWVNYEIQKAWNEGRGLLGIYIHNINCPRNGKCRKGQNPFDKYTINGRRLSSIVKCYDPHPMNAYGDIKINMGNLIEEAIQIRSNYRG
ncbi:TIR domain-containing protein [Methanolobus sediminis]|uniref:TIR domain-containing protein n=1 Tax=Methanolobus sediminis TaxID=3072978 RepID=A0AA51UN57_9EURY|nr:TIR domain-containing protein [Methanolobus sediminis]WMW26118.1 TIR domain-containing protein [Methanolobus sediminis]